MPFYVLITLKKIKITNHNILNSSLGLSSVSIFSVCMRDSRRSSPESSLSTADFFDLADFLDLVCLTTPDVDGMTSIGTSFGFSDFFAADFSFFTAGGFFLAPSLASLVVMGRAECHHGL